MLLPIKKIVVPTDLSERSFTALPFAVELAETFDAEIILVHVLHPIPPTVPMSPHAAVQIPVDLEAYRKSLVVDAETKIETVIRSRFLANVVSRIDIRWGERRRPSLTLLPRKVRI